MTTDTSHRSRWRFALVALAIVAALVVVAGVAISRAFPPSRLAAMLATEVQRATGREFRIAGGLSLRLLPSIAVVASDVTLGNARWGSRPDMASVKRAAFVVDVWPLLQGRLHVLSVDVDGADVLLETDTQGRPNWIFADAHAQPAERGAAGAPPAIGLDRLVVSNARIVGRDGLTRTTLGVIIESLEVLDRGDHGVVSARFGGAHRQWRLDGRTGPYTALLSKADWPFDVQVAADGARLAARGSFVAGETLRARVTVHIESAVPLAPLLGGATALPLPIDAVADFQRDAKGMKADPLQLSMAGQSLNGKLAMQTDRTVPRVEAELAAESLDLSHWLARKPAAAQSAAATKHGALFSDTPLPPITLPTFPLHATVRIDRLVAPGLPPLSAVRAEVRTEPNRLVLDPLSLAMANGQVQARLELGMRPGEPLRVKLHADARALSVEALDAMSGGGSHFRGGSASLRASLEAVGHTPHALAATTSGSALLQVADTALVGNAAVMEHNIIVALFAAILPQREAGQALPIACAVVNLPLRAGVARIDRTIAIETDKVAVAAVGELNLGAQTVALSFRPATKKGLGLDSANLAQLVMLSGPLQDPRIGVDVKGAALGTASVGVAVATGGLSLVGKRMLSGPDETHVCRQAAAGAPMDGAAKAPVPEKGRRSR